jgi:hypothetical protein
MQTMTENHPTSSTFGPALGAAHRSDCNHAWPSLEACEERRRDQLTCPPGLGPPDPSGHDDHVSCRSTSCPTPSLHSWLSWRSSPPDRGDGRAAQDDATRQGGQPTQPRITRTIREGSVESRSPTPTEWSRVSSIRAPEQRGT